MGVVRPRPPLRVLDLPEGSLPNMIAHIATTTGLPVADAPGA